MDPRLIQLPPFMDLNRYQVQQAMPRLNSPSAAAAAPPPSSPAAATPPPVQGDFYMNNLAMPLTGAGLMMAGKSRPLTSMLGGAMLGHGLMTGPLGTGLANAGITSGSMLPWGAAAGPVGMAGGALASMALNRGK